MNIRFLTLSIALLMTPAVAQPPLDATMYSGNHLTLGELLSAELLTSHPQMSDGSHADCFHLDTVPGKEYAVTLRSSVFDSYLMLGAGPCADVMLELDESVLAGVLDVEGADELLGVSVTGGDVVAL